MSGPLFVFAALRVERNLCCPVRFSRNSHRESGVFSFVALLSPVESSKPLSGAHGAHSFLVRLRINARK